MRKAVLKYSKKVATAIVMDPTFWRVVLTKAAERRSILSGSDNTDQTDEPETPPFTPGVLG